MHDTQLVHRNGLPGQNSNRRRTAPRPHLARTPAALRVLAATGGDVTRSSHVVPMLTP